MIQVAGNGLAFGSFQQCCYTYAFDSALVHRMTLHWVNILIHAAAGTAAIIIGFYLLAKPKGTEAHRRQGKVFSFLGLVVCATAALGLIVFRFLPLFSVITLLVFYQLVSGWRVIYTKENGPNQYDAGFTLMTVLFSIQLIPIVLDQVDGSKIIVLSTFGALVCVLIYDAIRWFFPHPWYRFLWRYEHSYKLLSSLFGMLSAFVGNTIRFGQPWSQIIPSMLGLMCIGYVFYKLYREDKRSWRNN